ncbi:MAG TPA: bifunctional precorrin-2 dehydrogenase/sirohydrochlorin ferrochelatase [Methanocella sp.]|nr:bifunctional precorrin-2 dehydrogenase/sirohydrochlorin ferrochelatase [Methanocella sp.]
MARYQPLFVDFAGKKVVVFGGGAVGERKAAYFAGADVTVVSRRFSARLEAMPGIRLIRREVAAGDLPGLIEGAFLAIAATGNPTLDAEIARVAGGAGVLVNSALGGSDVILPAKIERGEVTVAVSTGGRSPAMARYIRQRLEGSLGAELSDMVRLQDELRGDLKKKVRSQEKREELLWQVLEDPEVWEALKVSYGDAKHLAFKKLGTGK